MTEHVACYELRSGRDISPATLNPQLSWSVRQTLTVTADVATITSALVSPGLIPPSAWIPNGNAGPLKAVIGVVNRSTTPLAINAYGPDVYWAIQGAYTGNTLPNFQQGSLATFGRQAPPFQLVFGGDAFTAVTAGPATVTNLQVTTLWGYHVQSYQSLAHVIDFEDRPPNTNANGSTRLLSLLNQIQDGGLARYLLGVNGAAQPIYALGCGYAGILPEGRVFVRPEDIGPGPDQVGQLVADNTAAKFRAHPGVFLRRTDYLHSLQRQCADPLDITDDEGPSQPLRITQITTAPTASTWLLIIDGVSIIVTVPHPANSDLRRPRDIWNAIWFPATDRNNTSSLALQVAGTDGVQTAVGAVLDRLTYLEYARCLAINGTNVDYEQFLG